MPQKKNSQIITKETIKRLVKDVQEIMKNPLNDDGIFYQHDDTDMLRGKAMIVGQQDTPYFGGYYFFDIIFPSNYPFSPPKVTYCTNGDNIRFNPNLYSNGKVCVSILNTWSGEQWSSCQSIRSVLLALSTLLCKDPLLNEPGITPHHPEMTSYTSLIEYKNVEIAILHMLNMKDGYFMKEFEIFKEDMEKEFIKNAPHIEAFLREKQQNILPYRSNVRIYRMRSDFIIDYRKLFEQFVLNLSLRVPDIVAMKTEV
jgi:ubiquitin-conjugating enzyme E2 Z